MKKKSIGHTVNLSDAATLGGDYDGGGASEVYLPGRKI